MSSNLVIYNLVSVLHELMSTNLNMSSILGDIFNFLRFIGTFRYLFYFTTMLCVSVVINISERRKSTNTLISDRDFVLLCSLFCVML